MAKHFWILPLLLWGIPPAYGQDKVETPKQTNDKIFHMAETRRYAANRDPDRRRGLIHIDVFDVRNSVATFASAIPAIFRCR